MWPFSIWLGSNNALTDNDFLSEELVKTGEIVEQNSCMPTSLELLESTATFSSSNSLDVDETLEMTSIVQFLLSHEKILNGLFETMGKTLQHGGSFADDDVLNDTVEKDIDSIHETDNEEEDMIFDTINEDENFPCCLRSLIEKAVKNERTINILTPGCNDGSVERVLQDVIKKQELFLRGYEAANQMAAKPSKWDPKPGDRVEILGGGEFEGYCGFITKVNNRGESKVKVEIPFGKGNLVRATTKSYKMRKSLKKLDS